MKRDLVGCVLAVCVCVVCVCVCVCDTVSV